MIAPDGLNLCAHCDELIDPFTQAHTPHDRACTDTGWCRCSLVFVHPTCCPDCMPVPVPGQVEAFPVVSTRGLPKRRTS